MSNADGEKAIILVVEDDPDIRETIAQILDEEGYVPIVAENGQEALRRLAEGPRPRLILLDLMMPIMDGWEFREQQRQDPRYADIPVIIVSADGNVRQKATKLGADGHIRKPVGIDELLAVVQRYCA
ncbi:response regulator [Polyangium aurulentum]|uniref:response regulator n=1 Tax=Polyangium aurulentum TaxID=2567896 RepID=UPI00146AA517|nr:response regulator [Polyangium aurulentum]UQA59617.1 response regulator [Polyangium aurulentum]